MSLSFLSGSLTVANWGFSAGDVAVIAGAGRKAGTWLLAQFKDRTLFDWMNVDVDAVFTRKGLFETADLHKRWDQKIYLLKNGQRSSFQVSGGTKVPVVQQMDRFTWFMTLCTAALDAAMPKTLQRQVLTKFLLKLFEENPTGADFLRHEAEQHIEGWMSAACVRNIALRARHIWEKLGKEGKHQPGYIPEAELDGVFHFLCWLVNGEDNLFRTASTDILSLAMILENLGIGIQTTEDFHEHFDESDVVVSWSNTIAPAAFVKMHRVFRPGMRIPLLHIEEVASLFPVNSDRNKLRSIFQMGMDVVKEDELCLQPRCSEDNPIRVKGSPFLEEEQDLMYVVQFTSRKTIPRLAGDVNRLADWMFPAVTPAACNRLLEVTDELSKSEDEQHNIQTLALSLDNQAQNSRSYGLQKDHDYGDALHHLQAFFLGYWYQLLLPLLDTSQLATQEAFGFWGWSDICSLDFIREIVHTRLHQRKKDRKVYSLYRHEILKLTAYLFGGAEISQVQAAKFGAVGILGKIPVLYSSLVRGNPGNFGKFSLLDIDPSCIPSNTSGVVFPGNAKATPFHTPQGLPNSGAVFQPKPVDEIQIQELIQQGRADDDFTIHIEPDWNYDSQTCLVTYRHKGRVVHRLNPRQIDLVLARYMFDESCATKSNIEDASQASSSSNESQAPPYKIPTSCNMISLSGFEGGMAVAPEEQLAEVAEYSPGYVFTPILVNTSGVTNAFVCLVCMYEGWEAKRRTAAVSTQEEFMDAVNRCAKVIFVMPSLH
jgi:hypothetical protein